MSSKSNKTSLPLPAVAIVGFSNGSWKSTEDLQEEGNYRRWRTLLERKQVRFRYVRSSFRTWDSSVNERYAARGQRRRIRRCRIDERECNNQVPPPKRKKRWKMTTKTLTRDWKFCVSGNGFVVASPSLILYLYWKSWTDPHPLVKSSRCKNWTDKELMNPVVSSSGTTP